MSRWFAQARTRPQQQALLHWSKCEREGPLKKMVIFQCNAILKYKHMLSILAIGRVQKTPLLKFESSCRLGAIRQRAPSRICSHPLLRFSRHLCRLLSIFSVRVGEVESCIGVIFHRFETHVASCRLHANCNVSKSVRPLAHCQWFSLALTGLRTGVCTFCAAGR